MNNLAIFYSMYTSNPIGLGTAALGRPQYINLPKQSKPTFDLASFQQKGLQILETAYQEGIRYFDTAPGYGLAEKLVCDWAFEKNDPTVEIATKWGYTYVANFDPNAKQHEVKEHSLAKLDAQWSSSKNLLPWLTTYQIHSATFESGVLQNKSILARLLELKEQFNLRIGITTTGSNQIEIFKKSLDIELQGKGLFDVFQITYNIFDQSIAEMAQIIKDQNKRLIIKEALANGRVFPNTDYTHYKEAYRQLNYLAQKYQAGVDAIAIRFCLDSIPVYKVLSGAAYPAHVHANLQALNFKLEKEDEESLRALATDTNHYWNERKALSWN